MLKLFRLLLGSAISGMFGVILGMIAAGLSARMQSPHATPEVDAIVSTPLLATALIAWLAGTCLTAWLVYRRVDGTAA